jgi:pre-rRNA-processing protein IPI1
MEHPTRGVLPGPYKNLPPSSASPVRLLVLDVVAMLVGSNRSDDKGCENLSKAVILAVAGEEQYYWSHVSSSFTNK